ncbi:MAG: hypothetical protein HYV63_31730 [Candidatus Schekmanbacteria bacterium]|nr:hypothetical protein [Candidatus Schekmanbacteria bacterium]
MNNIAVNFARRTNTRAGLRIEAYRDGSVHEKGRKVTDKEMDDIAITRGDELGKWSYTIEPRPHQEAVASEPAAKPRNTAQRKPSSTRSTKHPPSRAAQKLQPLDGQPANHAQADSPQCSTCDRPSGAGQVPLPPLADATHNRSPREESGTSESRTHRSSGWPFRLYDILTGLRARFLSSPR